MFPQSTYLLRYICYIMILGYFISIKTKFLTSTSVGFRFRVRSKTLEDDEQVVPFKFFSFVLLVGNLQVGY